MEKGHDAPIEKDVNSPKATRACFDLIDAVVTALIFATIFLNLICIKFDVVGLSMVPTLHNNDKLFVYHLLYEPQRGDIIVIKNPGILDKNIVKRIIAKEGDTLEIDYKAGKVYVNGKILNEPYINMASTQKPQWDIPSTIPRGYFFVMGDNRGNSTDSRFPEVGLIDRADIMGKAICVYYPFNRLRIL